MRRSCSAMKASRSALTACQVRPWRPGSAQGHLEQGALPGQRGAQLVGGVGDETPLGVERGLQPGEQVVEGVAEFLELVVGSGQGQALVQAAGGDPPGGGGDRAQRAQHPSGDEPAESDGGDRDDGQGDAGLEQQLRLSKAIWGDPP